jgi:16S rRNA (guanine966-N2)-methyltransferase
MRIIAGKWRGRKLITPEGPATRPTADRVREALFSMLASRIGSFEELRVADLYAGSGALGLEALSRGAAFACFVDSDPAAAGAIRANVDTFSAEARAQILTRRVEALPPQKPFDLIFADPPYAAGSGTEALARILSAGWF